MPLKTPEELRREDPTTDAVIGAAIEVHRVLGPGLLESFYESALCVEMEERGISHARQLYVPAMYKGRSLGGSHRIDLVAGDHIVIELKCAEALLPVHTCQLLTYMRLTQRRTGLLINFRVGALRNGLRRLSLPALPR